MQTLQKRSDMNIVSAGGHLSGDSGEINQNDKNSGRCFGSVLFLYCLPFTVHKCMCVWLPEYNV